MMAGVLQGKSGRTNLVALFGNSRLRRGVLGSMLALVFVLPLVILTVSDSGRGGTGDAAQSSDLLFSTGMAFLAIWTVIYLAFYGLYYAFFKYATRKTLNAIRSTPGVHANNPGHVVMLATVKKVVILVLTTSLFTHRLKRLPD